MQEVHVEQMDRLVLGVPEAVVPDRADRRYGQAVLLRELLQVVPRDGVVLGDVVVDGDVFRVPGTRNGVELE